MARLARSRAHSCTGFYENVPGPINTEHVETGKVDTIFGESLVQAHNKLSVEPKAQLDKQVETLTIPADAVVVELTKRHNLTLIVGKKEDLGGIMVIRVKREILSVASIVWDKMLNGPFRESHQDIIAFPEDRPSPFLTMLRIAHWNFQDLPEELERQGLFELATLVDKYSLSSLVVPYLTKEKWLEKHKRFGLWPLNDLQQFIHMTKMLELQDDYEFLVSRLAMKLKVDRKTMKYHYLNKELDSCIMLDPDLPNRIIADVCEKRAAVLQEFLNICNAALKRNIKEKSGCTFLHCRYTRIGLLVQQLEAFGMFPVPTNVKACHDSVHNYFANFLSINHLHKNWNYKNHDVNGCFGDFGITGLAQSAVQRHVHKDLWVHWQNGDLH